MKFIAVCFYRQGGQVDLGPANKNNQDFFEGFPDGSLEFRNVRPEIAEQLVQGKRYKVEITEE